MKYKTPSWYQSRKKSLSKSYVFEKEAEKSENSIKNYNIVEPEEASPNEGTSAKASSFLDGINKSLETKFKDLKNTIEQSSKTDKGDSGEDVSGIFGDDMGKRMLSIGSFLSGDSDRDYWDSEDLTQKEMDYAVLASKFFGVTPGVTGEKKQGQEEFKIGEDLIEKVVDFPTGGVNRENQKIFYNETLDRLKSLGQTDLRSFVEKMKAPDYKNMGQQKYFESTEYTRKMEELGVFNNSSSTLFDYFFKLGLSKELDSEDNFIVCLRQTRKIKNMYSNSFCDIFFLVENKEKSRAITSMLGSSTPSPIFRYKKGLEFLIGAIGLRGLIPQSKPFIVGPGKIEFSIEDASNKSKFYGSGLLKNTGTSFKQYLYPLYDSESSAKTTASYKPDFGKSYDKRVYICPSIPGGTSEFLDACTSGDIVIQRYKDYKKILNAASENGGKIKLVILEDVESKETVNESLKYLRTRNF